MTNFKEILRMNSSGEYSQREIALSLHVSRNTVARCIASAIAHGIEDPVPESMTNEELASLLFPRTERRSFTSSFATPDFERLAEELKKPHVTKKLLWKEYLDANRNSGQRIYSITQFNVLLNDYIESHNISIRRDRNPGEVLELDWSGSAITMHGKVPGVEVKCHLFVAAFPFSGYFYAEAFPDEKIHSWLKGIADSLSFFGGVPVILRPDNTKTATIKADRYEPELNEAMIELSEYYRTVTIPARVRKPRDKNVVENSVGFASTYIVAALRNQVFYSLNDINNAVYERMQELNNEPFTKKDGCRSLLFMEEERQHLGPLPSRPFELFKRARAKVAPDYHVQFDKCFYSVHPRYIGKEVCIRASVYTVIISLPSGEEIARHDRGIFRGQRMTNPVHIPQEHREVLGWSGDKFRSEAYCIGKNTHDLIDLILSRREYEVQSYRVCRGILNLKSKVGKQVLEKAAQEALSSGVFSYKGVKTIAESMILKTTGLEEETEIEDDSAFFLTHSDCDEEGLK